MTRNTIKRIIKIFLLLYALTGVAFYYLQDKILLHPEPLPRSHAYDFPLPFEEKYLPMNKEDTIHLVRFLPSTDSSRGAVIYWHGNRKNVERYARYAEHFTSKGFEVWMADYPGFGKSSGKLDEKKIYRIGDQVLKLVKSRFPADSIIIYGKSFGTGVASYLASYSPCKALILETPYYSIHSIVRRYLFLYPVASLSHYELPVWKFLDETRSPVTIIHGEQDGVIFYRDAVKLKAHLKKSDVFVTVANGSHNDLADYPLFHHVLDSVLYR